MMSKRSDNTTDVADGPGGVVNGAGGSGVDVDVVRSADIDVVESHGTIADPADEAEELDVASDAAVDVLADKGSEVGIEAVAAAPRVMIDPRGPRFGAAITVLVLAVALLTIPSVMAVVLLVVQAIVFGVAALFGLKAQPYGILYRSFVAPRLRPPDDLEDEAAPRFAQQVGLVFVLVAIVALALSAVLVAQIATAFALAAAFLNAAFNFCLGCEIYLLVQRLRSRKVSTAT
jgi:hypothetical protein